MCQKIANTTDGTFEKAPLKGLFRAMEKSAMRSDIAERFRCTNVYDVVRGELIWWIRGQAVHWNASHEKSIARECLSKHATHRRAGVRKNGGGSGRAERSN